MQVISGFEKAKLALSRQAPREVAGTNEREQAVRQIIDEVRSRGDAALFHYTLKLDGVKLTRLEVTGEQIAAAYHEVDSELVSALKLAAERVSSFHTMQKDAIRDKISKPGLAQLVRPLARVGVYAPGGTASYPSTVLMTAVPARIAGVGEIILTTPPQSDGTVTPATLVAADIARIDRVFSVGGAQAIAALAFGTESVPRVDKVCGPGNVFVTLAKKLVYGAVGIDGLQGPSEVVIIADGTANPEFCAADLLAQAEHDPLASAILITTSTALAERVNHEIKRQLTGLPRREIISESLEKRGIIAIVSSVDEAIELANLYAPEHLCLMVDKAASLIDRVRNAGCIFIGEQSPVALGDYVAGPSHVLPTSGTARFSSPLNVSHFLRFTNVINLESDNLRELYQATRTIARAEGLEAHAQAVEKRLRGELK